MIIISFIHGQQLSRQMCPLSELSQLLVLLFMILVCGTSLIQSLILHLHPKDVAVHMYEKTIVNYSIEGELGAQQFYCLVAKSNNPDIAEVDKIIYITNNSSDGSFDVLGNFLGTTNATVEVKANCTIATLQEKIKIRVTRQERVIDKIFTISVATLVSIIFINFGCALKWDVLKSYVKNPIGPFVGFLGQFTIMPLLSYVIGYVIFPNNPEMQLGIFFTGCAPGGGGSNIWTAVLDGNIDLSIAMTTISTFAAFAMIPLWTFTLGALIFDRSNISIPYMNISTSAIGLVIPLTIGLLLQKYNEKVSTFLRRSLKAFSVCLIIFIIIFATVTNLYLFKLFSWRIIISGMGLPWLGYVGGWIIAKMFKQPSRDCLTIAIEVGLQNTGIAIFLLRFSLPQPEADLTTIAPISVAIMTPIPLFTLFVIRTILKRKQMKNEKRYPLKQVNDDFGIDSDY